MNIEGFCKTYNLGEVISITELTGGLMHKMYKVETSKNIYAIKVLNREVISRPEAYANFIKSETISNYLALNNIKVSNALKINNNYLNKYEDDYYLVFNFIDGRVLKDEEITIKHCKEIATILSKIHHLNYKDLDLEPVFIKHNEIFPWELYLSNPNFKNIAYHDLYLANYLKYASLQKRANERFNNFYQDLAITHQDLDPKNVLWQDNKPIIIDFEAATISSPYQEAFETALNWSGFLSNNFNEDKFIAFFTSYLKGKKLPNIDWYDIICGNLVNRFSWLHYNLKRSLKIITNDQEEIKLATNEVIKTIDEINRYLDLIGPLTNIINNITSPNNNYDYLVEKIIANNNFLPKTSYNFINSGFTNTIYEVGDYIIRICTDKENESSFQNEINFYEQHSILKEIPHLYLSDSSKKIIPYSYEILEKISGPTIYEIWPTLDDSSRQEIITKIVNIISKIHSIKVDSFNFSKTIQEDLSTLLTKTNIDKIIDLNSLLNHCSIYFKDNVFGLIHHDLHFDNFIYHNNKVYLIDFEQVKPFPIDYDFKIFYRMQTSPWKWASIKTDMLTVPSDYENLISYFKNAYPLLNTIKYFEERLTIYTLIDLLKEYLQNSNPETKEVILKLLSNLK